MINIGVLGSTNGTDLQAVIDAIDNKIINASIKVVISNRKNAFILKRAENHNIKARYVTHKNKTRNEFDEVGDPKDRFIERHGLVNHTPFWLVFWE